MDSKVKSNTNFLVKSYYQFIYFQYEMSYLSLVIYALLHVSDIWMFNKMYQTN